MSGAIDTLDFARKLRDGGVDERTADTIAQEVGRFVADSAADKSALATKEDIARLETNQRWQKWALGFIIAALIGVFWNLLIISQKLAALTVMVERLG